MMHGFLRFEFVCLFVVWGGFGFKVVVRLRVAWWIVVIVYWLGCLTC